MSGAWNILEGDCLDVLRTLPERHYHCVVTSPPYWGLRDYGVDGQIGLEETPQAFIAKMVDVFREVHRVLRDDGTCWVNMGDSYVHGQGGRQSSVGELPRTHRRARAEPKERDDVDVMGWSERSVAPRWFPSKDTGWKPKDLVGMPWMLAFALRDDGWYLRQDIIWHKPNPMPESVRDRCTKAHEYIFLLTKKPRYYYDAEAIKEPLSEKTLTVSTTPIKGDGTGSAGEKVNAWMANNGGRYHPESANKRSVWTMSTRAFSEAHFATFPMELPLTCIKAGTSERGCCAACGAPWRRLVSKLRSFQSGSGRSGNPINGKQSAVHGGGETGDIRKGPCVETVTTGWEPTCKCGADSVPCRVLDPFGGAGTTVLSARRLGRHADAIELNPEYAAMARRRIVEDAPLLNTTGAI